MNIEKATWIVVWVIGIAIVCIIGYTHPIDAKQRQMRATQISAMR